MSPPAGTAADLVAVAAAFGIDTDLAPPTEPIADHLWAGLLTLAGNQRVLGTLAAAVSTGAWATTHLQRDAALARHREWMGSSLRLERELIAVGDRLDAAGVSFQVLKGTAIAHLDYEDPSLRCFGDVDLLISSCQIDIARTVLTSAGGTRHYAEPRPGFDRRFSKGLSVTTPNDLEIDLHRTLAAGPFGLAIDLDELAADSEPFALGTRTFLALGRPQRFLHASYHAVLGSAIPMLVPLRDVAQTAPVTPAELARVLELARSWRSETVVAAAVRAATVTLGWRAPADLAAWSHARVDDRRERRWLAGYTGEHRAYATQALVATEAVPGIAAKASYLLAIALPRGADRGAARRARWQRGVRSLRRSIC